MSQILHRLETPATRDRPAAVWTLERHNPDVPDFAYVFSDIDGTRLKRGELQRATDSRPTVLFYGNPAQAAVDAIHQLVREYVAKSAPAAARG